MAQTKKCSECQKEITSGKFYSFYIGKKGGKTLGVYKNRDFFCPPCAEKEEKNELFSGALVRIEWEVGNQTDEEIIKFEEKWNDHSYDIACRTPGGQIGETSFNLDFIQKVKQELEPYLQKPQIVEKSFGGKIEDHGVSQLGTCHFFTKSARDGKYRQAVIGPTFTEILGGGDPNQEINVISSSITNPSDAQGTTRGIWKINENLNIPYIWNDNEGGDCRYVSFLFSDPKLALQALCRSLKIKEKELRGDNSPNQNPPKPNSPVENLPPENKGLNGGIIFLLITGGVLFFGAILWLVRKRK